MGNSNLDVLMSDWAGFKKVKLPTMTDLRSYTQPFFKGETWKPCLPTQLLGVEVECERVASNTINGYIPDTWIKVVPDGSLRNSGLEFVTCPHKAEYTEELLTFLFANLGKNHEFSPRTSIHVHMNVQDMKIGEVASLLYVYLTFERLLYKWVGNGREDNIFCVPLQQTMLPKSIHEILTKAMPINWTKYCGMNLSPYRDKGTVEFRHLHGTDSLEVVLQWIQILLRMMKYAKSVPNNYILPRILSLNTNSEYRMFLEEVFEEDAVLWFEDKDLISYMEKGVAYLKAIAFENPFCTYLRVNTSPSCELFKRLNFNAKATPKQQYIMNDITSLFPPQHGFELVAAQDPEFTHDQP